MDFGFLLNGELLIFYLPEGIGGRSFLISYFEL
jgi:hypothetical protein